MKLRLQVELHCAQLSAPVFLTGKRSLAVLTFALLDRPFACWQSGDRLPFHKIPDGPQEMGAKLRWEA